MKLVVDHASTRQLAARRDARFNHFGHRSDVHIGNAQFQQRGASILAVTKRTDEVTDSKLQVHQRQVGPVTVAQRRTVMPTASGSRDSGVAKVIENPVNLRGSLKQRPPGAQA